MQLTHHKQIGLLADSNCCVWSVIMMILCRVYLVCSLVRYVYVSVGRFNEAGERKEQYNCTRNKHK